MNRPLKRSNEVAELQRGKLSRAAVIKSNRKPHEEEPEQLTTDSTSAKYTKIHARKYTERAQGFLTA